MMFIGLLFKMLLKEIFFFCWKKIENYVFCYMYVYWFILVLGIGNFCDFLDENKLYFIML